MAITLVQANTSPTTNSGPVTATLPAPPTAGNLLVATFGSDTGTTPPTPSGWTQAGPTVASGVLLSVTIWTRIVVAGDLAAMSYTPPDGTNYGLQVAEFAGMGAATLDTAGVLSGGNGLTTVTTDPTAALQGAGDLRFVATSLGGGSGGGVTFSAGLTKIDDTTRILTAWGTAADQTPKTATTTWTNARRAVSLEVDLTPGAAVPGGGGTGGGTVAGGPFIGWGLPMATPAATTPPPTSGTVTTSPTLTTTTTRTTSP